MKACSRCGFIPEFPPAGGACPYCGKQGEFKSGCGLFFLIVIIIIALAAAFG